MNQPVPLFAFFLHILVLQRTRSGYTHQSHTLSGSLLILSLRVCIHCWGTYRWKNSANKTGRGPYRISLVWLRAYTGLWVRRYMGLSWWQSWYYLQCTPDMKQEHTPSSISTKPTGVHPGTLPTGPQVCAPRNIPWDPQYQEKPIPYSLDLHLAKTMRYIHSTQGTPPSYTSLIL